MKNNEIYNIYRTYINETLMEYIKNIDIDYRGNHRCATNE